MDNEDFEKSLFAIEDISEQKNNMIQIVQNTNNRNHYSNLTSPTSVNVNLSINSNQKLLLGEIQNQLQSPKKTKLETVKLDKVKLDKVLGVNDALGRPAHWGSAPPKIIFKTPNKSLQNNSLQNKANNERGQPFFLWLIFIPIYQIRIFKCSHNLTVKNEDISTPT